MERIVYILCIALVVLLQCKLCEGGAEERQILDKIFKERRYSKFERPVVNESEPIAVNFSLTLQQIIDVDEKNQIVHSNLWLNMKWRDPNLAWNRTQFPNVKSIRLPADQVWRPDILLYNSAHINIDGTYPTHVVIKDDGSCLWVPPGIFLSTCRINIKWFPFDDQLCELKFGSWTHEGGLLDLQLDTPEADNTSLLPNGEWIVVGFPGKRNTLKYDCCPEEYIDLTFTLHIRRRSLFYTFNLVVPCAMISSMEFLAFTLPPESGEKISLGVTILLSLTVFSMMVSESMPQTSDAVPLIGTYFASIMLMCSMTVVFTVVVLNFHHRTSESHTMPLWVRKGICEWLAWLLRMQRPGRNVTFRSLLRTAKMQDLEMGERSSRSLLANVLDLDDDFRRISHSVHVNHVDGAGAFVGKVAGDSIGGGATRNGDARPPLINRGASMGTPSTTNRNWAVRGGRPGLAVWSDVGGGDSSMTGLSEMRDIVRELRTITARLKKEEATQDVLNDWRFAAQVVDRLCLYLFIILTAITSSAILLQAPHFA